MKRIIVAFFVLINVCPSILCQTSLDSKLKKLQQYSDRVTLPVDSLLILSEHLLLDAHKAGNQAMIQEAQYYKAHAFSNSEKLDSALLIYQALLEQDLAPFLEARVHMMFGFTYHLKGEYNKSLASYTKAYSDFRALKKQKNELMTLYNLGRLYKVLGDDEKALETYYQVFARSENLSPIQKARLFNALGTYYSESDELDSAELYYQRALDLHVQLEDKRGISHGYNNLAIVAYYKGDIKTAIEGFKAALKVRLTLENQTNISDSYFNIGFLYANISAYNDALFHYKKGLSYAKNAKSIVAQKDLLLEMSKAYEKLEHFDSAYFYLQQATLVKDSILNQNKQREIVALQQKFENDLLRTDKVIAEKDNQLKTSQRNLLLILFGLVLVGGIWVYFFQKRKYNENLRLNEKDIALAEKEVELVRKEVELKQEQIAQYANQLLQKTELLEKLKMRIEGQHIQQQKPILDYERITADLAANLSEEKNWLKFKIQFESAYPEFFGRLLKTNPELTSNDLRLSSLIKLSLTTKEIAQILSISTDSVSKAKYRLRNKFNFKSQQALEVEIQNL